ncbi:uncharacterized protein MKK02DRAFT_5925, partial [Dioszegia hungarica]
ILDSLHEGAGHKGRAATYAKVWSRFYWPNQVKDVEEHIRSCAECQHRDYQRYEGELTSPEVPTLFGQIHIDCTKVARRRDMPPGVPTVLILARDSLTGWCEGAALPNQKAETVANWFLGQVIPRIGLIGQCTVDRGTEFKGQFQSVLAKYHIKLVR